MNEKSKVKMGEQVDLINNNLSTYFQLPIFQDEVAEDELPKEFNYFLIVYGDMEPSGNKAVNQEINVIYVTENNDQVDEDTIDIISLVQKVSNVTFVRTIKQRGQKKETDEFVDQVTVVFDRKIPYECQI